MENLNWSGKASLSHTAVSGFTWRQVIRQAGKPQTDLPAVRTKIMEHCTCAPARRCPVYQALQECENPGRNPVGGEVLVLHDRSPRSFLTGKAQDKPLVISDDIV
jgi:hypothetical protein